MNDGMDGRVGGWVDVGAEIDFEWVWIWIIEIG
jgi:hypothetical protein